MNDLSLRLLTLLGDYLCFTPAAITPEDMAALRAELPLTPEEAYGALLCARLGLDVDQPEDARLYRQFFPRMLRQLDPDAFRRDPYMLQIGFPEGQHGRVRLTKETLAPMELFVADDFLDLGGGNVVPQLGFFPEEYRYPSVSEDGQVWMTVTPNEIATIQPAIRRSHGRVLTFGLGLGYYCFHCLLKKEVARVTAVERNPEVIALFRELLLPRFPRAFDLEIIEADAFDYAQDHLGEYDTVFTDLWHDVGDGLPLYTRMKALEVPGPTYLYWIEKTLRCYE